MGVSRVITTNHDIQHKQKQHGFLGEQVDSYGDKYE
jgi:hypothetical protein